MNPESHSGWRTAISQPLDDIDFHPLSTELAIEVAAASVCGRANQFNTDHYLALRFGRLQETLVTSLAAADLPPRFEEYAYAMLVADGLGEEARGVRASRLALSALARLAIRYGRWNVRADQDTLAEIVQQGEFFYRRANDIVLHASEAELHLAGMATSLTAVYIAEGVLTYAQVGHSRAYLCRQGELTLLTKLDTLAHEDDAKPFPVPVRMKADADHLVTKVVGMPSDFDIEIEHVRLSDGDRLLLCTNGLTDVVSDDRIADTLALKRRPQDDCQRLIELASTAGSQDDVTVLVADYHRRAGSETADLRDSH